MVFVADKPAEADLLWEKNNVPWLISQPDKFKWTWRKKIDVVSVYMQCSARIKLGYHLCSPNYCTMHMETIGWLERREKSRRGRGAPGVVGWLDSKIPGWSSGSFVYLLGRAGHPTSSSSFCRCAFPRSRHFASTACLHCSRWTYFVTAWWPYWSPKISE